MSGEMGRMSFMDYINKTCDAAYRNKKAQVKDKAEYEKKICPQFEKAVDGYCKNYIGIRPFIMSCISQCCSNIRVDKDGYCVHHAKDKLCKTSCVSICIYKRPYKKIT
jgi:hypothetical protein